MFVDVAVKVGVNVTVAVGLAVGVVVTVLVGGRVTLTVGVSEAVNSTTGEYPDVDFDVVIAPTAMDGRVLPTKPRPTKTVSTN